MNRRGFIGMMLVAPVVAKAAPFVGGREVRWSEPPPPRERFTYSFDVAEEGGDYVDLSLWRTNDYGETWHLIKTDHFAGPRKRFIDDEAISKG